MKIRFLPTLLFSLITLVACGSESQSSLNASLEPASAQFATDAESVVHESASRTIAEVQTAQCYKCTETICAMEVAITKYTNQYRAKHRLPALKHNRNLAFVARKWSRDQGVAGRISHNGFPSAREAVYRSEFAALDVFIQGENVAMISSYSTVDGAAKQLVDMWYNSAGHRRNMLGNHKIMGSGVDTGSGRVYATQLFGQ